MDDILMFIGGALLSGLGGACIGYLIGRGVGNYIQISGNNSKQIMIGNINHNNKCNSCKYSKFIEPEIAMKSLYCSKQGYICDQIDQCSEYKKE